MIAWLCFLILTASARTLETNQFVVHDAPEWLTTRSIDEATEKVQNFLEWDIRKVPVYWYSDPQVFQRAHGLGPTVLAAAKPQDGSVHMGPKVNASNFHQLFSHELTHVIVAQKYKSAIPKWLEEGLANYVGGMNHVDYAFLKSQGTPRVQSLTHAFRGSVSSKYHYAASTAVMEMIAAKCSIKDLLQLSVGKNLETYLKTYCEIPDLDAAFGQWVSQKAKTSPVRENPGEPGPWWKKQKTKKHWWQK